MLFRSSCVAGTRALRSRSSSSTLPRAPKRTFRAAKIVNGLLNLARPAQVDTGPCDINAVINDVLSLLDHQFRTGSIQVRKELADRGPIVQGIEHKLQQVFLNLFLNARDAMPKGGWLTIATREDANGALVDVADTGSGRQRADERRVGKECRSRWSPYH